MGVIIIKVKIFKFKSNHDQSENNTFLENLLFGTCILCFLVLIIVQIILAVPSFRNTLHLNDKSIGLPLKGDEYLYTQGQMTLKILGEDPDPMLKILVNGDKVAQFDSTEAIINVRDGDVIEIDGSQSLVEHVVKVESITTNINAKCKNAVIRVENNIRKLVKVQME